MEDNYNVISDPPETKEYFVPDCDLFGNPNCDFYTLGETAGTIAGAIDLPSEIHYSFAEGNGGALRTRAVVDLGEHGQITVSSSQINLGGFDQLQEYRSAIDAALEP